MWKLTIEDDQANKTVVHLVRDEYSIGRAEDNAIRLTERNVSRRHAKVDKDPALAWVLHDLGSYNGIYINGLRVAEHQNLNHGDLVQLGDYRITVEDESLGETRGERVQTVPGLPRLNVSSEADRLMQLVGPEPGTEISLSQRRMVVGRGEECDISINHPSVSRVHSEIIPLGDGRYEIRDLKSANGLRVNGVDLPQTLLDARDVIELGDVILKFIPAGEFYIPGADDTQARAALAQAAGIGGLPSAAKWAIGAGVAALALVLLLALRSGSPTELAVDSRSSDRAGKLLAEAKVLLANGDAQAALGKANEIPADSNLRDSADFKAVYAAWADAMLERAKTTEDPAEKRAILEQVARTTSVDSVRRKKAAGELETLGQDAVDISALPNTHRDPALAHPVSDTVRAPPASEEPKVAANPAPALVRKNPFGGSDPPPAPVASDAQQDLVTSGERTKLLQAKNMLQAKAQSGQASERDLKMLKALCKQLGDASCSN